MLDAGCSGIPLSAEGFYEYFQLWNDNMEVTISAEQYQHIWVHESSGSFLSKVKHTSRVLSTLIHRTDCGSLGHQVNVKCSFGLQYATGVWRLIDSWREDSHIRIIVCSVIKRKKVYLLITCIFAWQLCMVFYLRSICKALFLDGMSDGSLSGGAGLAIKLEKKKRGKELAAW